MAIGRQLDSDINVAIRNPEPEIHGRTHQWDLAGCSMSALKSVSDTAPLQSTSASAEDRVVEQMRFERTGNMLSLEEQQKPSPVHQLRINQQMDIHPEHRLHRLQCCNRHRSHLHRSSHLDSRPCRASGNSRSWNMQGTNQSRTWRIETSENLRGVTGRCRHIAGRDECSILKGVVLNNQMFRELWSLPTGPAKSIGIREERTRREF